jgi:hypothetical protein
MSREDPFELAQAGEREAEEMQERSQSVEREVKEAREDWERKRADKAVPGANPPDEDAGERRSPAPQAPPPSAGPADAQTPAEGGSGPPADVIEEDDPTGP